MVANEPPHIPPDSDNVEVWKWYVKYLLGEIYNRDEKDAQKTYHIEEFCQ